MKGFIILISLMCVSVSALAQQEGRAALRFDEEGGCAVDFHYGGEVIPLYGDFKARVQYAGGSLEEGYSNAMMQCQGHHYIDLPETVVFHGGFCVLTDGVVTDDVNGVVNKGGKWLFNCTFARYKEPSE